MKKAAADGKDDSTKKGSKFELTPRLAYSALAMQPNTCTFMDDRKIVFPVGRHLWHYDIRTKKMEFLSRRSQPVTPYITIANNGTRLAVCENNANGSKKCTISILALTPPNISVVWKFQHCSKGRVVSASLSSDAKAIAVHVHMDADTRIRGMKGKTKTSNSGETGEVSCVAIWTIDTRKFIASIEVSDKINQVSINPEDSYLIVAIGDRYLRYLKTVGSSLDEVPLLKRSKERSMVFVMHKWFDAQTLICATDQSEICVFIKGELVQTILLAEESMFDDMGNATAITVTREGFIIGTSKGKLVIYHLIKAVQGGELQSFQVWKILPFEEKPIIDLQCSPNKAVLMCLVKDKGLCKYELMISHEHGGGGKILDEIIVPTGKLLCMDANEQRDILITADVLGTLRLWTKIMETRKLVKPVLQQTFEHGSLVSSLSIHPSGFQVLLVLPKIVSLYHILVDGFKLSHSIQIPPPIQSPVIVKYSNGGHKFAVGTGSNIWIYSSTTMGLLHHISVKGVVNCVDWAVDDSVIASASDDGSVYSWELFGLRRCIDHVDKGVGYTDFAMDWGRDWEYVDVTAGVKYKDAKQSSNDDSYTMDGIGRNTKDVIVSQTQNIHALKHHQGTHQKGKGVEKGTIIACGKCSNDAGWTLSDISDTKSRRVEGDENYSKHPIRKLVIDKIRGIIVSGTSTGFIGLIRYPVQRHNSKPTSSVDLYAKYAIHENAVEHMILLQKSGVLLTAGSDGNLFVMDMSCSDEKFIQHHSLGMMQNSETKMYGTFDDNPYDGDGSLIMVEKNVYKGKLEELDAMATEVKQQQNSADYKMRTLKEQCSIEIRELRQDMEKSMSVKDKEVRRMEERFRNDGRRLKEDMDKNDVNHERENLKQRDAFESKLNTQYMLNDDLKDQLEIESGKYEATVRAYEQKIKELQAKHQEILADNNAMWDAKVKELQEEMRIQVLSYEEVMSQAEDEHDAQVAQLQKLNAEARAKAREATAVAYAEASGVRRKLDKAAGELSTLKLETEEAASAIDQKNSLISSLKSDLSRAKEAVQDREKELTKRQHVMSQSDRKSKMLNNFIQLLEHRIHELEEREAPTVEYIKDMRETVSEMEMELFTENRKQKQTQYFADKKQRENARLKSNVQSLRSQVQRQERRWSVTHRELQHIVEHTPSKEWEATLKRFYFDFINGQAKELDKEEEDVNLITQNKVFLALERQRKHLEQSLDHTKGALKNTKQHWKQDKDKAVTQNTLLIAEVNNLRNEKMRLEQRLQQLQTQAKISQMAHKSPIARSPRHSDVLGTPTTLTRPSSSGSTRPTSRASGRSGGGRLFLGTTRPLSALSTMSNNLNESHDKLAAAHRTVELQKLEISHLQEGVNVALDLAQNSISQDTSSKGSTRRKMSKSASHSGIVPFKGKSRAAKRRM